MLYIDSKTGKGPYTVDSKKDKPNILLITQDMVPPEFYNIDSTLNIPCQKSLASDGISYDNAFATSPLCGPSRASILTGRYSYITGNSERSHDGHQTHLRSEDIIYPEYLKAIGYHCRHIGKSHVGTEHFMRAFSENSSPWNRWSPPWYDEDLYIKFLNNKNLERFTFKREIKGMNFENKKEGNSYGGWLADQNNRPFPEEATYPAFLINRTIDTLETRKDKNSPFYMQLDFFGPHQPFAIPGGWEKREDDIRKDMILPESWLEWEKAGFPEKCDEPRAYDLYRKNWGLRNREDVINYRIANQLQYEILDHQITRLIEYLKDNNLYDNTLILFTADHGEMNGKKGCIDKGAYINPQVLQVPFIVKPPKDTDYEKGQRVDEPVSLLDILPTVCHFSSLEIPLRSDGVSLIDTANGLERPFNKPVMADVWNHVVPNPCVGIIFKEQSMKYLYSYNCTQDMDELYQLGNKKLENLINKKKEERARAIRKMHEALVSDSRWDVYKGYFELEYTKELALKPGDSQKFE